MAQDHHRSFRSLAPPQFLGYHFTTQNYTQHTTQSHYILVYVVRTRNLMAPLRTVMHLMGCQSKTANLSSVSSIHARPVILTNVRSKFAVSYIDNLMETSQTDL